MDGSSKYATRCSTGGRCHEELVLTVVSKERELARTIKPFDASLLAPGRAAVAHRQREHELEGQARGGVPAAAARAVASKPPLDVSGPAGVERAVGAAQHVDPRVSHRRLIPRAPADSSSRRRTRARRSLARVHVGCARAAGPRSDGPGLISRTALP